MTDYLPDKQHQGGLAERVYEKEDIDLMKTIQFIEEEIKKLFQCVRNSSSKLESETISITIAELKKQKVLIKDHIRYREKQRAKVFVEHIKLIEDVHENQRTYEAVGRIYGLSLSDIKNSFLNFLAISQMKEYIAQGNRYFKKKDKDKDKKKDKDKEEEKRKRAEAKKSSEEEKAASEEKERGQEQEEKDRTIKEFQYKESQIENKVKKALKIWRDQQEKVRMGKRPFANEDVGVLLAEAVLEMDILFEEREVKTRDEHVLRQILFDKLEDRERDYFSDMCRDAVRQCNSYLRGQHPQQSLIASVLQEDISLEETVLAFDQESACWWWLFYVYRQFITDNVTNELDREFREYLIDTKGLKYDASFAEFFADYEADPDLQEVIVSTFSHSFDKAKKKESNVT